jgi:shikimate kinase
VSANDTRHVVLCGTAGSGKSTVGAIVARTLGRTFVDIDRLVEHQAGMKVRTIFQRDGEAAFRARERAAVVRALASPAPLVIALGGGSLENDATFADVRAHTLVWLEAPVWALASRVMATGDRPLLAGGDTVARLRELAAAREPRYRQAHLTVDATENARRVAARVVGELRRGRHVRAGAP